MFNVRTNSIMFIILGYFKTYVSEVYKPLVIKKKKEHKVTLYCYLFKK